MMDKTDPVCSCCASGHAATGETAPDTPAKNPATHSGEKTGVFLCLCAGNDFIKPEDVLNIQAALSNYHTQFVMILPSLCSKEQGLPVLEAQLETVDRAIVVACHPRAQKWLFGSVAGNEKLIPVSLRGASAEAVIQKLDTLLAAKPEHHAEWFPVIDRDRCTDCGQCLDFCLFGVFTREDGKVIVQNPYNCKDLCPACARVCPTGAIVFAACSDEWIAGADLPMPDYKKRPRAETVKEMKRMRRQYLEDGTEPSVKDMIHDILGEA